MYVTSGLSFAMHILFCLMFPSHRIVQCVARFGCELGDCDTISKYLMLFYSSVAKLMIYKFTIFLSLVVVL